MVLGSRVDQVIERALAEAAEAYGSRGIRVERELSPVALLATDEPVLEGALSTIFRALPHRLTPGARLRIWAHERAGGDIELAWEAEETVNAPLGDAHPLARGPGGDLLELAVEGLARFCRARAGHVEVEGPPLTGAPDVHRRYFFLIPSLRRDPSWRPRKP